MSSEIKKLAGYAIATVSVAASTVLGIAILTGFKGAATGIDNTTVDLFITGLAVFGTFMSIITLSLVGKTVIGLFKSSD